MKVLLDNRRYRITDEDVSELRSRTLNEELFDGHSQWVKLVPQLDALVQEIADAFEGTELGDGIGLLEANGIDDYASAAERAELRSRDEKTDWRRIESKTLNYCYAATAYLDARGFWFHLPAFLIAELNDQYGLNFIEILINTTRTPGSWHDLLTQAQCAAIIKTLKLVAGHPDFSDLLPNIDVAIEQLKYRPLSHVKPTTARAIACRNLVKP